MKGLKNLSEKEKKAIGELIEGLRNLYKDNLTQLILYGSKARGDSEDGSDIDILVILKKMDLNYDEIKKINDIAAPISLRYDLVLSALPKKQERFNAPYKTIFIHNVVSEGELIYHYDAK